MQKANFKNAYHCNDCNVTRQELKTIKTQLSKQYYHDYIFLLLQYKISDTVYTKIHKWPNHKDSELKQKIM